VIGLIETVTGALVEFFQGKVPRELIIFIISLFPILELRGGMIAAKLLDVELVKAFFICYAGNILPIPFILLFIRRIFALMRKSEKLAKLVDGIEKRSMKKSEKVLKFKQWGLLLFVAVPLPGTGGWTGALLADLLDIRLKKSLPIIALGVLIADLIMSVLSYGLLGAILGR
jgi:uncharacterized membrane protein